MSQHRASTELFGWYYHAFLVDGQVSRLLPLAFGLLGVAFAAWTLVAFVTHSNRMITKR